MPPEGEALRADRDAFTALYERHHGALYRYCRSIVGQDHDAQDAVQSTMTLAFAALRHDKREFDRRPWLFRIAHNESISILRRRRATVALDPALPLTDAVSERAEAAERLRILRQDLADLAERQRSALLLRELRGLGVAEIADLLGMSPGAVKQAIFEARRELSKCGDGRATPCLDVQRLLSDGDGRVTRGRPVRAHLRSCAACRRFQSDLVARPPDLAALAAPSSVAALLVGQASGGAGAIAGAVLTKIAIGAAVIVVAATIPHSSHPRHADGSLVRRRATIAGPAPGAPARAASPAPATHVRAPSRVPAKLRETTAAIRAARRSPARSQTQQARESAPASVTASAPNRAPDSATLPAPGNSTAPGQAKRTESASTGAPGQAKKIGSGSATPPGQAKKTESGTAAAKRPSKKIDPPNGPGSAGTTAPGQATAPGQSKQTYPAAAPDPPGKDAQGSATPPGQDDKPQHGQSGR